MYLCIFIVLFVPAPLYRLLAASNWSHIDYLETV